MSVVSAVSARGVHARGVKCSHPVKRCVCLRASQQTTCITATSTVVFCNLESRNCTRCNAVPWSAQPAHTSRARSIPALFRLMSLLVYFSAQCPHGCAPAGARSRSDRRSGGIRRSMFHGARRAIGNGRMCSRALIIMLACAHGWTGVHGWTAPARAEPMSRPRCATLAAIEGTAEEAPRPARSSSGPRLQGGNQRPLGIDPANRIKQVVRDTSLPLRVELLRSRLPEGCATTTGA